MAFRIRLRNPFTDAERIIWLKELFLIISRIGDMCFEREAQTARKWSGRLREFISVNGHRLREKDLMELRKESDLLDETIRGMEAGLATISDLCGVAGSLAGLFHRILAIELSKITGVDYQEVVELYCAGLYTSSWEAIASSLTSMEDYLDSLDYVKFWDEFSSVEEDVNEQFIYRRISAYEYRLFRSHLYELRDKVASGDIEGARRVLSKLEDLSFKLFIAVCYRVASGVVFPRTPLEEKIHGMTERLFRRLDEMIEEYEKRKKRGSRSYVGS